MQLLMDAFDPNWAVIYMLLLVLAAGWLAANLTLAVIYEQVHVSNVYQRKVREADVRMQKLSDARAALAEVERVHSEGDAVACTANNEVACTAIMLHSRSSTPSARGRSRRAAGRSATSASASTGRTPAATTT